jgi:hypothetical protein
MSLSLAEPIPVTASLSAIYDIFALVLWELIATNEAAWITIEQLLASIEVMWKVCVFT